MKPYNMNKKKNVGLPEECFIEICLGIAQISWDAEAGGGVRVGCFLQNHHMVLRILTKWNCIYFHPDILALTIMHIEI
jgi:hypothetical protein